MEPFGLLPFLQSLLSEQPKNNEEMPPVRSDGADNEKAEFAEQTTETLEPNSPRQNAAASFLTAHEKRSSRIKK